MRIFTLAVALATGMAAVLPAQADEASAARTDQLVRPASQARMNTPRKAPLTFDVTASDIVYDTPSGVRSMKSKAGKYYSSSIFGIAEGETSGIPCEVVEGDGTVWIYNPYTGLDTRSWLKGDVEGDRITFRLPQAIYTDSDGENDYVYVAQMCYFQWSDDSHEDGLYYPYEGETEMVFLKEDGKWVMQQQEEVNEHPVIMGLVAADDGTWCSFSEWNTVIGDFSAETVSVPSDLVPEQWTFLSLNREYDSYPGGMFVNVGISGEDIYVQGLSSNLPDAWVRGKIEGGKVQFPSRQYLGADVMANMFAFFFGAKEEEKYNEEWGFSYFETTLTDNIEFEYDAESKTLRTSGTVVINRGEQELSINESFSEPRMRAQGDVVNLTPADPIPGYYSPMGDYAGALYFAFPNLNNEEQIINTDNLYYRVYVDGYPFTFYTDEYVGLPEDTEEIPFDFTNNNTIGRYGTYNITHFFSIMFDGYESMDIQTVYRDGDKVYESAVVPVVGPSVGVKTTEVTGEVVSVEWTDMQGRRVAAPERGIYVKRTHYSDGNVRTEKVAL